MSTIFAPMVAVWILTVAVWFYMYSQRLPFLLGLGKDIQHVTARELNEDAPRKVINPSDNLKNLFELPVVFYAVVLFVAVTNTVDTVYIAAAWGFAGFRIAHSLVHCTFNHITTRFFLYVGGSFALFVMVGHAAFDVISGAIKVAS